MRYRRAATGAALLAASLCAGAEGRAARDAGVVYDLSIAGVPIGEATLRVVIDEARYRVEGTAEVGFLFWGGSGRAVSEGRATAEGLAPESYRLRYEGATRPGAIDIAFEDGRATRWERRPDWTRDDAEDAREARVALRAEDLAGVLDPLSALVIPAPEDIAPEALCRRVRPVFTGYTRFDLDLGGAAPGPAGAPGAVVCAARYRPVSGHRVGSQRAERMQRPGAFSVRLAPVGEGVWGPDRVALRTRFGTFELLRRR